MTDLDLSKNGNIADGKKKKQRQEREYKDSYRRNVDLLYDYEFSYRKEGEKNVSERYISDWRVDIKECI